MKAEELLKNISGLLKKHEDFFNNNPELFYAVEGRLLKALDDEDEEDSDYDWANIGKDEQQDEDEDGSGYGDDLFDRVPSEYDDEEERDTDGEDDGEYGYDDEDGDDEASKWLREHGGESEDDTEPKQFSDFEEESGPHADEDEAVKPAKQPEEKQKRSSRYVDWKPRDNYEPKHADAIKKYMDQGYSHREAERFANAHKAPTDFYSALRHSVNPSEPSPKMLELMRGKAGEWLKNAERKHMETADASLNPIKHASGKAIAAHDAAHKDFNAAYNSFLGSDEVKNLKGRDRHQAIQNWKKKWNEENPEYTQAAVSAAGSGKALSEALEARKERREEGMKNILDAGKTFGAASTAPDSDEHESDFGHPAHMDDQVAAQSIGGEKNEGGGYSTNIKKDPSAIFAEKNPEYVKHLQGRIAQKLSPEQSKRMSAIDSFKNKGNK